MQANELIATIRENLQTLDREIREHPFLGAVEKGEVSEAALCVFPGHQYHLIVSIIRTDGKMLQRFGGTRFQAFFYHLLGTEIAAYASLELLAGRLGMDHDDLERFEVDPEGFTFASYVTWLAHNGSLAEIVCGLAG